MQVNEKDRPCPFCGGTKTIAGGDDKIVGTFCLDCGAAGPNGYQSKLTWNDRAAAQADYETRILSALSASPAATRGAAPDYDGPTLDELKHEWPIAKPVERLIEALTRHNEEMAARLDKLMGERDAFMVEARNAKAVVAPPVPAPAPADDIGDIASDDPIFDEMDDADKWGADTHVAEVLWYDPRLDPLDAMKPRKIIDGSLVFMDNAQIGTKLFATPPAARSEPAAEMGWPDISTAPKDGTWFVALEGGETYPCSWMVEEDEDDEGRCRREGWYDHFNQSFENPEKWAPVATPEAPVAQEEAL